MIKQTLKFFLTTLLFLILPLMNLHAQTEKVTLQLKWIHQFQFAGYYAAIEKGYYKDEGLEVEIKEDSKGINVVSEVLSGKADYGVGLSSLVLKRMNGKPVVLLANYIKNSALVMVSNPSIRNIGQLKGKKIAFSGSISKTAEFSYMFDRYGISPSDIKWVKERKTIDDIVNGSIDAFPEYITKIRDDDETRSKINIHDPANYGLNFYGDNLFTSQNEISENPERTIRFIRATNKGWKYAVEHKDEIIELILKKYNPDLDRETLQYEADKIIELIMPRAFQIGSIDPERIRRISDIFLSLGFSTNPVKMSEFIFNYSHKNELIKLTEKEKEFIKNNPVINVANEYDWPPFDFTVAGKPMGFGIDLTDLIFHRVGLTPKYINGYSWAELIEKFDIGEIMLMHSISMTEERKKTSIFSTPYFHSRHVVIYRKNQAEPFTFKDLEHKIIALPKGWSSIDYVKKYYPEIHVVEVENLKQALEYVEQGKVYATIEQEQIGIYLINKLGFTDLAISKWIDDEDFQRESSMHFSVKKENEILMSIIEKSMDTITPGEMSALTKKWFHEKGPYHGDSQDPGLTITEKKYLQNKKEIKFVSDPSRMPIEAIENGEITGMTADFVELISKKLNIKLTLVPVETWSEAVDLVKDKKVDLVTMLNQTKQRKDYLLFTKSLITYNYSLVVKESFPFISGLEDLNGKTLALPKDYHYIDKIKKRFPKIKIMECKNIQETFLKVYESLADAAMAVLPVAGYNIRTMGLNGLKIGGHMDFNDELRLGIRSDDKVLHQIISKTVNSISSKEIETILNKWSAIQYQKPFDYSLLKKIGLIIFAALTLIILWNRKLMLLNKRIKMANQEIKEKSRELEKISITDFLTNLFNRRHVETNLIFEIQRVKRYKRNLSIILIDVDNFKEINDTLGHQIGDHVLVNIAEILKNNIRKTDIPGRWGGEEFLIICPETDLRGVTHLAENLREKIELTDFSTPGSETISLGVAEFTKNDDDESLIKRADKALYKAKRNGKNRVENAELD